MAGLKEKIPEVLELTNKSKKAQRAEQELQGGPGHPLLFPGQKGAGLRVLAAWASGPKGLWWGAAYRVS